MEPLRVYVGLNSAETAEQRAELALAELIRVGAFGRAVLVIATPTGTGWVDPAGLGRSRSCIVAMSRRSRCDISSLPSWLSLLIEPDYGADTARAVFHVVYDYWRTLPRSGGRAFICSGLASAHGIPTCRRISSTSSRTPIKVRSGWAPPGQRDLAQGDRDAWSREPGLAAAFSRRIALPLYYPAQRTQHQHALGADPHSLFAVPLRPDCFFRDPLLASARLDESTESPDVASEIRWIPVVTFVQQICDMMTATTTPRGVGHVYAAAHYLDGWIAVTEPQGWNEDGLARLREWLNAHDL